MTEILDGPSNRVLPAFVGETTEPTVNWGVGDTMGAPDVVGAMGEGVLSLAEPYVDMVEFARPKEAADVSATDSINKCRAI